MSTSYQPIAINTEKPELSIKLVTDYLSNLEPNIFLKMVLDCLSIRLRNNFVRLEEVMQIMENLFDNFKKNKPKHFEPTAQMLFDYEEHYMRLVKSYREEIKFINDLHTTHTQEVKNFYANDLPTIIKNWSRSR